MRHRAVLFIMAFVTVGASALMPVIANPGTAPRKIVLVVRDMAFYMEGSDVPNPTIVLKASEEVLVVVKNQDPGIQHGFTVDVLTASIRRVEPGAVGQVSMRAPAEPGRHEYVCPPHAQMMRGVLLITE